MAPLRVSTGYWPVDWDIMQLNLCLPARIIARMQLDKITKPFWGRHYQSKPLNDLLKMVEILALLTWVLTLIKSFQNNELWSGIKVKILTITRPKWYERTMAFEWQGNSYTIESRSFTGLKMYCCKTAKER